MVNMSLSGLVDVSQNSACVHRRSKSAASIPNDMSGLLIDEAKHISNLEYRVWEKILDEIDYCECTAQSGPRELLHFSFVFLTEANVLSLLQLL